MESKTGKRIVSKGEYVAVHGKRAGIELLGISGCLFSMLLVFAAIILFVLLLGGLTNMFTFPEQRGEYIAQAVFSALGILLFVGVSYLSARWGENTMRRAAQIDPGVPLTRANTAALSAPDTLVRASSEPLQAQEAVLLRAATDSQETPSEQLVRPAEAE